MSPFDVSCFLMLALPSTFDKNEKVWHGLSPIICRFSKVYECEFDADTHGAEWLHFGERETRVERVMKRCVGADDLEAPFA